jgi:hypothetical protein
MGEEKIHKKLVKEQPGEKQLGIPKRREISCEVVIWFRMGTRPL